MIIPRITSQAQRDTAAHNCSQVTVCSTSHPFIADLPSQMHRPPPPTAKSIQPLLPGPSLPETASPSSAPATSTSISTSFLINSVIVVPSLKYTQRPPPGVPSSPDRLVSVSCFSCCAFSADPVVRTQSNRFGPDSGLDSQICLLGGCLLIT